jgi:hypothetical protein
MDAGSGVSLTPEFIQGAAIPRNPIVNVNIFYYVKTYLWCLDN